jgi:GNAT superfamily N-acetyltransferase
MHIRAFCRGDAAAARDLLQQLGYEVSAAELRSRIECVLDEPNQYVAVAEERGQVVGLLHAFERVALEKPCEAVVQALVVDRGARGRGIGKVLMGSAEAWARARGLPSILISTRNAQDFYARLGYDKVATSALLRKKL